MKIATYNVWYPNINIRAIQLIEEINGIDADIIGLQEVPPVFYEELIANIKYPHHAYISYTDNYVDEEKMGLAFFSKHPLSEQFSLFNSAEFVAFFGYRKFFYTVVI